jgi:hypothetical protein
MRVAADASLTRMPKFGWATIASGESLLLKRLDYAGWKSPKFI